MRHVLQAILLTGMISMAWAGTSGSTQGEAAPAAASGAGQEPVDDFAIHVPDARLDSVLRDGLPVCRQGSQQGEAQQQNLHSFRQLLCGQILGRYARQARYQVDLFYQARDRQLEMVVSGLYQDLPFLQATMVASPVNVRPLRRALKQNGKADVFQAVAAHHTAIFARARLKEADIEADLQTTLDNKLFKEYWPVFDNASKVIGRSRYPVHLRLAARLPEHSSQLTYSTRFTAEEMAGIELSGKGQVTRPVLPALLKGLKGASTGDSGQSDAAVAQLCQQVRLTQLDATVANQHLLEDLARLSIGKKNAYLARMVLMPFSLYFRQLAQHTSQQTPADIYGGIGMFLSDPGTLNISLSPVTQPYQNNSAIWSHLGTVVDQEARALETLDDLHHPQTDQAEDLQRLVQKRQRHESQVMQQLQQYFRVKVFVNGQRYIYTPPGSGQQSR